MQDRNEHLQIILKNFHLYTLLFLCVYMHALFVCVYERERGWVGEILYLGIDMNICACVLSSNIYAFKVGM